MNEWQSFCTTPASPLTIEDWIATNPNAGLAVACGYQGLIAFDIDHNNAIPAVREVFGTLRSPSKQGRRGGTAFFRDPGSAITSRRFRSKTGEMLVEVLSTGSCTVLPPTIHKDTGKPYRWCGVTLEDVSITDLPEITQANIDDLATALVPLMPPERIVKPTCTAATIKQMPPQLAGRYFNYAMAVLNSEVSRVLSQTKPGRNERLFRSVCNAGKWVHHGFFDEARITAEFLGACTANGLVYENGQHDCTDTIQDALRYSCHDPLPVLRDHRTFRRW